MFQQFKKFFFPSSQREATMLLIAPYPDVVTGFLPRLDDGGEDFFLESFVVIEQTLALGESGFALVPKGNGVKGELVAHEDDRVGLEILDESDNGLHRLLVVVGKMDVG
jgi:hypothetical protein